MLLPGVKVLLKTETDADFDVKEWHFHGGIAQYLDQMIAEDEPVAPTFAVKKTDGE